MGLEPTTSTLARGWTTRAECGSPRFHKGSSCSALLPVARFGTGWCISGASGDAPHVTPLEAGRQGDAASGGCSLELSEIVGNRQFPPLWENPSDAAESACGIRVDAGDPWSERRGHGNFVPVRPGPTPQADASPIDPTPMAGRATWAGTAIGADPGVPREAPAPIAPTYRPSLRTAADRLAPVSAAMLRSDFPADATHFEARRSTQPVDVGQAACPS